MSKKNKVSNRCPDPLTDCIFCMVNKHTGRREIEFGPLLNKALYSRYSAGQEVEDAQIVQDLIDNRKIQWVIQFREQVLRERDDEFLKRFYPIDQHLKKMRQLVDYYRYHRNVPRIYITKFIQVTEYFHNKYKEIRYRQLKQEFGLESRKSSQHSKVKYSMVLQTFLGQQSQLKSQEQSTQIVYQELLKQLATDGKTDQSYSLLALTRRESVFDLVSQEVSPTSKKKDILSRKSSLQQIKTTFSNSLNKSKKQLQKISNGFYNFNRLLSSQASPTGLQQASTPKNFSLNSVYSKTRGNLRQSLKTEETNKLKSFQDSDVLKLIKGSKTKASFTTHQQSLHSHQLSPPSNYSPPNLIQNKVVARKNSGTAAATNARTTVRLSPNLLTRVKSSADIQNIQRQRIQKVEHITDQNILDMFKKWQQSYVQKLNPYQFDSAKRLPTEYAKKEDSKHGTNRIKTEQSSVDKVRSPAPKYTKSLFTLMKKKDKK